VTASTGHVVASAQATYLKLGRERCTSKVLRRRSLRNDRADGGATNRGAGRDAKADGRLHVGRGADTLAMMGMPQPSPSAARILVVDDERCYRVYVATCLRSRGHWAHMSASGPEALAAWDSEGGFDLVVTDLQMPGMDGLQLRDEIWRRWPGTRVLVMTGGSARSGVHCKPLTHHGLFALVESALHGRGIEGGLAICRELGSDEPRR
jgi:CheY-like chemotaxis protein